MEDGITGNCVDRCLARLVLVNGTSAVPYFLPGYQVTFYNFDYIVTRQLTTCAQQPNIALQVVPDEL